jgi:TM2 domain-containing membrane protein YozV
MKNVILLLIATFIFTQMPTTSTFATTLVTTGQTVTTVTTASNTTSFKVKKTSKFKMWIAKQMAKSGSDKNPIIGAVIAFFLGGLGIHRVYMGSKPIMILWYILTIGGIFGLLPLIDFIRLLIGHGDHYDGNEKLFAAFGSK